MKSTTLVDLALTAARKAATEAATDDACPSCGCVPSDGFTSGCYDTSGCGWARYVHYNPTTTTTTKES